MTFSSVLKSIVSHIYSSLSTMWLGHSLSSNYSTLPTHLLTDYRYICFWFYLDYITKAAFVFIDCNDSATNRYNNDVDLSHIFLDRYCSMVLPILLTEAFLLIRSERYEVKFWLRTKVSLSSIIWCLAVTIALIFIPFHQITQITPQQVYNHPVTIFKRKIK